MNIRKLLYEPSECSLINTWGVWGVDQTRSETDDATLETQEDVAHLWRGICRMEQRFVFLAWLRFCDENRFDLNVGKYVPDF